MIVNWVVGGDEKRKEKRRKKEVGRTREQREYWTNSTSSPSSSTLVPQQPHLLRFLFVIEPCFTYTDVDPSLLAVCNRKNVLV